MAVLENKIKYGLSNVHYAKATYDKSTNKVTYATPVPITGAVNLALKASGSKEPFYADNIEYSNVLSNNGYEGDLEIADMPQSFETDILKQTLETTTNVLFENGDVVEGEHFALLFQFEGDAKAIRHVFYWCSAERPEIKGKTKSDKTDPQTDTLNFSARPAPDTHDVKAKTTASTPEDKYNNWFKALVVKGTVV